MRDYNGYQLLIDRVAKIDQDAAMWLLHEAPVIPRLKNRLIRFYPNQGLSVCFVWAWTPQEYRYWRGIDRILEPYKYEYKWEDDE